MHYLWSQHKQRESPLYLKRMSLFFATTWLVVFNIFQSCKTLHHQQKKKNQQINNFVNILHIKYKKLWTSNRALWDSAVKYKGCDCILILLASRISSAVWSVLKLPEPTWTLRKKREPFYRLTRLAKLDSPLLPHSLCFTRDTIFQPCFHSCSAVLLKVTGQWS